MFGFLKEKLKKAIDNISDKFGKKPEKFREEPEKIEAIKEIKITEKKEKKPEEIKEKAKEESKSFFQKIKYFGKIKLDEDDFLEFFEHLELGLIENNVALEVIDKIKFDIKKELLNKHISKKDVDEDLKNSLKKALENILMEPFDFIEKVKEKKPFVIAFFGINGVGKTTTIARIANLLKKNKLSCVLSASDTFRAASIEQLQKHADKLGIKLVKHQYNADPAAVAFDAIAYAKAHSLDVVLIDTAGRMHSNENLIKEMEKIMRVAKPDMKIFVGESTTGNDCVEQAREFNQSINFDGIILSKADIDEKGGAAVSVSYITKKPILFLGTGQEYKDLEPFDKLKIIKSIGL